MKQLIRPVKGTRDFYPGDMAFRTWLYGQMKAASQKFGYPEFEAPLIETLELYAAKSGEELVKEQSFVFQDIAAAIRLRCALNSRPASQLNRPLMLGWHIIFWTINNAYARWSQNS